MNKLIDKLAWVFIRDGNLLVVRSKDKKLFYLPGGKREEGESDHQALIREIKEELSVDLIESDITYLQSFVAPADGKEKDVSVKLTCYLADYTGELIPNAEIAEYQFVDKSDSSLCSLAALEALNWLAGNSMLN